MSRVRANTVTNFAGTGTPSLPYGIQVGTGATVRGSTNTIDLLTSGSERVRIDSSGILLKSGQASLTSTTLSHPLQVAAASDANTIAVIGRAADDIGELSYYEADKTTKLGELQYRTTDLYLRHRSGGMRFATGGVADKMILDSSGRLLIGTDTEGFSSADDLTIAASGDSGITIRSGNTSEGSIMFSDTTSGTGEYSGWINYNHNSNFLRFYTNSSEWMRLDASGNLDIGTTTGSGKLNLVQENATGLGDASSGGINISSSSGASVGRTNSINFLPGQNTTNPLASLGFVYTDASNYGQGDLFFATRGSTNDAVSVERMRIDSEGDVHIGNNTSSAHTNRLLAVGNVSRSATYIECRTSDTGDGGYLFSDGTGGTTEGYRGSMEYSHSVDKLFFKTSGTTQLTIDSSGKVLIGATSDFVQGELQVIASGGGQLNLGRNDTTTLADNDLGQILFTGNGGGVGHVCGSIRSYADNDHTSTSKSTRIDFYTTPDGSATQVRRFVIDSNGKVMQYASAGTDGYDLSNSRSAGTSTANFVGRHSSSGVLTGTVSMACYTNGDIVNTNGSYTQISDISLKENIVDAPSQWDDLKAVKFRKFNFKESTGYETFTQIGVVAQELELTSPGLVYDAATPGEPGKTTKGVKSSILTMKALVALQEAMAKIETLEAKVAALEGS